MAQQKGRLAGAAEFVRNVRGELRRVTWPNRDQLQQSTLVVLIILLVLTAFVALWDLIFYYLAALIFT
ncbi:MAG TPA: preprotein translocase subunit SecE [Rubrobacteraceae bacterium]